jgi:hypothetical protein
LKKLQEERAAKAAKKKQEEEEAAAKKKRDEEEEAKKEAEEAQLLADLEGGEMSVVDDSDWVEVKDRKDGVTYRVDVDNNYTAYLKGVAVGVWNDEDRVVEFTNKSDD